MRDASQGVHKLILQIDQISDIGVFKHFILDGAERRQEFQRVNLVYGRNTCGKSTLCDILKDLSENRTSRIERRLTIPEGKHQQVQLHLSGDAADIMLTKDGWFENILQNQIMVFDTEYVTDNLFDGSVLMKERRTKENFTSFILGQTGVEQAQWIATQKQQLHIDKEKLKQLAPLSQQGNTEKQIQNYVDWQVTDSRQMLEECREKKLVQLKDIEGRMAAKRQIMSGQKLSYICCTKMERLYKDILHLRDILQKSYMLPSETAVRLNQYIEIHGYVSQERQQWVVQGLAYLEKSKFCPFCMQTIQKELWDIYCIFPDSAYQDYRTEVNSEMASVRPDWAVFELSDVVLQKENQIRKLEKQYGSALNKYIDALEIVYENTVFKECRLEERLLQYRAMLEKCMDSKRKICTIGITLDISELEKIYREYVEIADYVNGIIDKVNLTMADARAALSDGQRLKEETEKELLEIDRKLTRLDEETSCRKWQQIYEMCRERAALIKQEVYMLEKDQHIYLELYFGEINRLFQILGGKSFRIYRGDSSDRGYKKVVGVGISFCGQPITDIEKLGCMFSESDRRALALSVFIAKVMCMSQKEQRKLILVLDDPALGLDEFRSNLVITVLKELALQVEQIFVLTHHSTFAHKVHKAFEGQIACVELNPHPVDKDCCGMDTFSWESMYQV